MAKPTPADRPVAKTKTPTAPRDLVHDVLTSPDYISTLYGRDRHDSDHEITRRAVAKIVAAQARGTLSAGLTFVYNPSSVTLYNATEADLAWVHKQFKGKVEQVVSPYIEKRRRPGSRRCNLLVQRVTYSVPLRPRVADTGRPWDPDVPPVITYSGTVEHECTEWRGFARTGADGQRLVTWHCKTSGCGKKISVTEAKEMGLHVAYFEKPAARKRADA